MHSCMLYALLRWDLPYVVRDVDCVSLRLLVLLLLQFSIFSLILKAEKDWGSGFLVVPKPLSLSPKERDKDS